MSELECTTYLAKHESFDDMSMLVCEREREQTKN